MAAEAVPQCSPYRRSTWRYGTSRQSVCAFLSGILLGGFHARVPCYAGDIDLDLTLDELLRQTDDNLAKGFRAIKMKVGRKRLAEDIEHVKAMRAHLGEGFPLMVDANMKWKDLGVLKARKDGGTQCLKT